MIAIGEYHIMEVARITSPGAFLRLGEDEALLPGKFLTPEVQPGDQLEVFIFTDSEDRITATTQKPKAKVGEFAYLKVIDINKYGAFMDWGLDKDLFVPFSEQKEKLETGKKYVVRIALDYKTQRLIGTTKLRDFFKTDVSALQPAQQVNLLVFGETDLGIKVIIDHTYEGLLYKNEVFEELKTGDKTIGYIKKVRDDGKLDVMLYKPGMEKVKDAESIILNKLNFAGGFLPYNDATPPEIIKEELKMSKKVFKKAIGGLYKNNIIVFQEGGFVLNETYIPKPTTTDQEKTKPEGRKTSSLLSRIRKIDPK